MRKSDYDGSIVVHRIDYNGVGALRGQRHMLRITDPPRDNPFQFFSPFFSWEIEFKLYSQQFNVTFWNRKDSLCKSEFSFNDFNVSLLLWFWIGHFRVFFCLCFKTSPSAKPFIWKWVLLTSPFECRGGNGLFNDTCVCVCRVVQPW